MNCGRKKVHKLEIRSVSLHHALSLYLFHTNFGTFLLAGFQASKERSKHSLSIISDGRPERREKPTRFFSLVNKIAYQASDRSCGNFHKLQKSYDQWNCSSSKRDDFYLAGLN